MQHILCEFFLDLTRFPNNFFVQEIKHYTEIATQLVDLNIFCNSALYFQLYARKHSAFVLRAGMLITLQDILPEKSKYIPDNHL